MANLLQKLKEEMQLRGYSPKTIKLYAAAAKDLYCYIKKPLRDLSYEEVKKYILHKQHATSPQTARVYAQAINFLMRTIYQRTNWQNLPYAKRPSRLPHILSREEIRKLIDVPTNPKHRLLLALSYAAGLRVSEVVRLRVENVDLENNMLWIRQGKGQKPASPNGPRSTPCAIPLPRTCWKMVWMFAMFKNFSVMRISARHNVTRMSRIPN